MSLFPFLAVLLCTMGALIVLLVVFAHQAQLQANSRDVPEEEVVEATEMVDAAEVAKIRIALEDSKWRMEQVQAARDSIEEEMREIREDLSRHESIARGFQEELERKRRELEALELPDSIGNEQDKELLRRRIDDLQRTLAREMQELDKKRSQVIKRRKAYAVVPHTWNSATKREPIFLECTAEGIRIQPSGVLLTEDDIDGPGGPQAPLAASLRAVREYMARKALGAQSNERVGEPYPLMLVRKGGIEYFYVAQRAMRWDGMFGYELIEDDADIVYPEQDPKLTQVIVKAVDSSRKYQQRLRMLAQQRGGQITTGRDYLVSSRGLVPRGGSSGGMSGSGGSGIARRRSTSELPTNLRQIEQADGTGGGTGGGTGSGVGGIGALVGEGPGINFDRNGPGGGGGIVGGVPADPRNSTGGFGTGGAHPGQAARGANPYGINSAATHGVAGMNPASGDPRLNGLSNYRPGNGTTGTGGSTNPLLSGGTGSANGSSTQGGNQGRNGNASDGIAGMTGGNGGTSAGDGETSEMNASDGSPSGGAGGGSSYRGGMSSAGASMSAGIGTPSATTGGGCSVGGISGANPPSDSSDSRLDQAAPLTAGAAGQGEALRPGQWEDTAAGGGSPSASSGGRRTVAASPNPTRRKVWTTDRVPMGAVPVVRTVHVSCSSERLLISPQPGVDSGRVIYFLSNPDKAVDDLINIVVERMELWGMAGEGMYWRPVLGVRVEPDGRQRFDQVNHLLDGSGLRVELIEATRPAGTFR